LRNHASERAVISDWVIAEFSSALGIRFSDFRSCLPASQHFAENN
jgi:hypothetical protein